jgi:hypothetical protein
MNGQHLRAPPEEVCPVPQARSSAVCHAANLLYPARSLVMRHDAGRHRQKGF